MRVVSNTSPLSNLAIVNRLQLLRERYGRIIVPPAVQRELHALAHPAGRARLAQALADGWVVVENVPSSDQAGSLMNRIDPGEAEALALALQSRADILLIDDRKGRLLAQQHGQPCSGILGLLIWAKDRGRIESITSEMVRLITEARFFIHPSLQARLRTKAGEE